MGLLNWLKKGAQDVGHVATGVERQVNPFDNGATYSNPAPAPVPQAAAPAPMAPQFSQPAQQPGGLAGLWHHVTNFATQDVAHPVGNFASKTWDQVNPADNGRTWQHPAPQMANPNANGSLIHQLTHSAIPNAGGDIVKSFTNVAAAPIEMGRGMADQFITHDYGAAGRAYDRSLADAHNNIVTGIGRQLQGTGEALVDTIPKQAAAIVTGNEVASNNANDAAVRDFNKTPFGQVLDPVQHKLAEYQVHRDLPRLTPEQQKAAIAQNEAQAGLDPNASTGKQALTAGMGGVQLVAPLLPEGAVGDATEAVKNTVKTAAGKTVDAAGTAADTVATAAKSLTPTDIAANHPSVLALNDHLDTLNKINDNLTAQGLAENSPARIANTKAYTATLLERNSTMQQIAQGGYVRNPFVPEDQTTLPLDTQTPTEALQPAAGVQPEQPVATATPTIAGRPVSPELPSEPPAPASLAPEPAPEAPAIKPAQPSRGFTRSVQATDEVSPELKDQLPANTYAPKSNEDLVNNSLDLLKGKGGLQRATDKVVNALQQTAGRVTDQDISDAIATAKALDEKGGAANIEQATTIYDRLAEHLTAAGRKVQAASLLKNRTPQGMYYSAIKTLKNAGVELTPELKTALQNGVKELKATVGDEAAHDAAVQKFVLAVNKELPRSLGSKITGIWRSGLLTGPETAAKVANSHIITAPIELASHLATAPIDFATSLLTGKRSFTMSPTDYLDYLKGVKRGFGAAKTKLTTGVDELNTGGFEGHMGQPQGSIYERFPMELHGSIMKPNYSGAYDMSIAEQARTAAMNEGLKGAEKSAFIDKMKSAPSDAMKETATKDAENFANMQRTQAGQLASNLQKWKIGSFPIGEWLAPFTRIPTAIASKGIIDWTPLGVVKGAGKALLDKAQGGEFDQRAFVQTTGRAMTGSALTTLVGYELAKNGALTLAAPSDPKERALWQAEGKQANSIKIGGKWWSLNAFGPAGISMGLGGAYANATKDGGNFVNAATTAVAAAGKLVADQPYFKGVASISDALNDPTHKASTFLEQTAGSLVPAFFSQIARGTDPQQRAYPKSVTDTIAGNIPGLREDLPASHDLYGNALPGPGGTPAKAAVGTINPYYTLQDHSTADPVTNELQRLYDTLGTKSPAITPTATINVDGKSVKLDNTQQQDMLKATGPQIHAGLTQLINNPEYANLSDDDKTTQINNLINASQNAYIKQSGLDPNKKLDNRASAALIDPTTLGSSVSIGGTSINGQLEPQTQKYLSKMMAMSTDDRSKLFNSTPEAEYQYNLAKWQNDKLNGTLTRAEDIRQQQTLVKDQVGSKFDKETRDLYSLSKTEINDLISNDPDGNAIAQKLQAYDQALVSAGVIKSGKFKNGFGSGGSGGGSGGSGKTSLNKEYAAIDTTNPYKLGNLGHLESALRTGPITVGKSSRTTFQSKTPSRPKLRAKVASVSKKGKVRA